MAYPALASPTITVVVPPEYPLAPEYERVHFVGTALFNIGINENLLNAHADEAMSKLEEKVGYRVFLVDIKVKPRGLNTDVDFIMDVPYGYESGSLPVQGLPVALYIAIQFILTYWKVILLVILALGFIIWLFWTIYVEKFKIYYCDLCPDFPSFQGYAKYLAHLAEFHPEAYDAIADDPWWEQLFELGKYIPWVVGGAVAIAVLKVFAPRRS